MGNEKDNRHQQIGDPVDRSNGRGVDPLVSVESQREFDLFTGEWAHRVFVKLYVAARTSGLLSAISDRDWKTLCTLATYMDGDGYCFPSQAELAAAMGCSRQMANERVRSLASFRFQDQPVLVIVKSKRGVTGKWAGNGYQVLSLSSLRIYDAVEGPKASRTAANDSGIDSRSGDGGTVSSFLDTAMDAEATVSSQTVTVQLDTNKKHSSEQDLSFEDRRTSQEIVSSFEGSHDQEGAEIRGTVRGRGGAERAPMPLGEIVRQRAAATPRNGRADRAVQVQQTQGAPTHRVVAPSEERERLQAFLTDFAIELGDEAPLSSTITRALKLFKAAGVPRERWSDLLYQARGLTQEHTAQIRKVATSGSTQIRRKNKMPYFLATLEQLVGLRPRPPQAGRDRNQAS